ncbi:MAG: N-acetylglucosamine-6-phosphate deacetylase [Candidatus Omnitrophota bacterium]
MIDVKPIVLNNVTAITPFRRAENCFLLLRSGKIVKIGRTEDLLHMPDVDVFDLPGHYVLPGFIDVHVHGGAGFDCTDSDPDALDEIGRFHASHGTTSLIATVYSQPKQELFACIRRIRRFCESSSPHRIIEGVHLEGPFLNPEMHGAIRPDYMWPASREAFREIMDVGGAWIRVMTIAPEIPGAMQVLRSASIAKSAEGNVGTEFIKPLHLSIGHSKARYEQISEAIDSGLEGVTHIFNAMPTMHHRRPGVLVGTMLRDELFVEVIADTLHVHPAVLQLLLKVKKHDKILLVSDAIRAAGSPDGEYDFSGQKVIMREGRAYLADSPDTLAGSTLSMDKALKTMIDHAGASLEQAAQMASLNPARILEWKYRRGILAAGKDADLAVLDKDMKVRMTIKAGRIVYQA